VSERLISAALIAAATLVLPGISAAQDNPAGNLSVSYAALKDSDVDDLFGVGWVASIAGALTRSVELVGEVGGNYRRMTAPDFGVKVNLDLHSFTGGARYVARPAGRVSGYAQTLAGAVRISAGFSECGSLPPEICAVALEASKSRTYFALQPGAGVDIAIVKRLGLRVQGDYRAVFVREGDLSDTLHEFRFSVGVVLGFGNK
jgi:hypothetical protein